MNHPERPPAPVSAAAQALTQLGYDVGPDPVQELRLIAAVLKVHADRAVDRLDDLPPDREQRMACVLAANEALERAQIALLPLAEAHLDGLEQQHLEEMYSRSAGGTP